MSLDQSIERIESQAAGGVLNPLVIVRLGELQHRKGGGGQPECIKLSPDYYDLFMKAYASMKEMVRRDSDTVADQIDMARPHVLGIPIVCEPGARTDIEYYVPRNQAPRIIIP